MYGLFAGDVYYPGGGMNDYKGSFHSIEEAEAFFRKGGTYGIRNEYMQIWEWAQVVDLKTMEVILVLSSSSLELR